MGAQSRILPPQVLFSAIIKYIGATYGAMDGGGGGGSFDCYLLWGGGDFWRDASQIDNISRQEIREW